MTTGAMPAYDPIATGALRNMPACGGDANGALAAYDMLPGLPFKLQYQGPCAALGQSLAEKNIPSLLAMLDNGSSRPGIIADICRILKSNKICDPAEISAMEYAQTQIEGLPIQGVPFDGEFVRPLAFGGGAGSLIELS